MSRVLLLMTLVAHSAITRPLLAQRPRLEASGGIVIPSGHLGVHRGVGPVVRVGAVFGQRDSDWQLRLEAEALTIAGQNVAGASPGQTGRLSALGGFVSLSARARSVPLSPYFVAGIGSQQLRVERVRNPYGLTWAVRAGLGIRTTRGRYDLAAEFTPTLLLTDFATGEDYAAGAYVPITLRLSF